MKTANRTKPKTDFGIEVRVFTAQTGMTVKELAERGTPRPYDEVLHEIEERDWADTHREIAPLRRAEDAVLVDTSAMDFDESRRAILDVIRRSVEA